MTTVDVSLRRRLDFGTLIDCPKHLRTPGGLGLFCWVVCP